MTASVLNQLGPTFDTHLVEKRLLRWHSAAVASEILEFSQAQDTLHQFSAQLGKWIDLEFRGQIRQTQKVRTENLGGEMSMNQQWERTNAGTPIA
jgi:hypothetical protein